MNADEFILLEAAYDEVALLDSESQARHVAALRSRAPKVAERLESMLSCEPAPLESIKELIGETEAAARRTIGPYRILGTIGEGGFGIVHLAEQPAPIHRCVAIKVIKPGMDTRGVIARFNDERQALALMDHPSIVPAIDAGVTDDGRPYVVMPIVPGLPISAFAKDESLDPLAIASLVERLTRGVQHAHAKGVIHRDLKPSNILVSLVDGEAQPRIIDFGLAKALASPLTPHSTVTLGGELIGTPEYMAPEQAAGLGTDVRTDVYGLGAILYELLAGRPPLTIAQLQSRGPRQIHEVIADEPIAPPSRWSKSVPRELDWITLRCLEKDPSRRYPTAAALADDLRAYLAHGSIAAGPPDHLYRLWRWILRHRAIAISLASIGLTLAAASAVAVRFAFNERTARLQSQQVTEVVRSIFTGIDPSIAEGRDRQLLRDLLLRAEHAVAAAGSLEPEVECEVDGILAEAYTVAGEYTRSNPLAKRSLELAEKLWEESDRRRILATKRYVDTVSGFFQPNEWDFLFERSCRLAAVARASLPYGDKLRIEAGLAAVRISVEPSNSIDLRRRYMRELLDEARATLATDDPLLWRTMRSASRSLWPINRDSIALVFEARRLAEAAFGPEHPQTELGLGTESYLISLVDGESAAVNHLINHIGRAERLLGPLNESVQVATANVASLLLTAGDVDLAETWAMKAFDIALAKRGDSGWVDYIGGILLPIYIRQHRFDEARQLEAWLGERLPAQTTGSCVPNYNFALDTFFDVIYAYDDVGMPERADYWVEQMERQTGGFGALGKAFREQHARMRDR
jgi:eukaryotic-like serine/threonine-protein kinase